MKIDIAFIDGRRLIPHELVNMNHFKKLLTQISHDGFIDDPIIVDEDTMIILDGHHRYTVAQHLGLKRLPVYFVNYCHNAVKVTSWREGERITKKMVIKAGLSGKLLKPKTSRHIIGYRPRGLKISLDILK